jgi:tetratricopeptide (TPR) repeat protein
LAIKYLNFDLSIERSGTGYLARVLESPAGEASAQFELPFSQVDVENLVIQIGRSRLIESPEAKKIHTFGQELFEAIFKDDVRDRLRTSLGEVHKQGAGLRLRLRMAGLSELGNYPWEFMYDPSLSRFLALSVDTPIVRYLETSQVIQPLTVQPPLRILAMICSPKDYPRLDVEREWENLREAMQDLQSQGLVDLQRLEPPTLSALQQILRREQFHIFHFVGHGTFSTAQQDGMLLLEDERREGYRLSGRDLGTLLHDHRPLRLAVLNACEGARTSSEDQFAGTAQSLMQQGIPAVIAMQIRITDQAAIVLSHEFYGALADGYPVDAALTEARKAIKTQGNDLEWGTPVLYMRSPDGQIFDIAQPAMTKRPPSVPAPDPKETARVERIYTEALESFYLGKWEEAHNRLQEVVDSQPNHKDAAAKLEIVRRKLHLQTFDEQAATAEKASDWDKAIEALEKLLAEDPTFADATSRLAKALRQKQLADLYAEAQQLTKAEKWQAVLEIFREIDNVQPRNPDPQGLRMSAEQNLAKAKKTKEIETAYTFALTALDADQWQDAIRHLRRVRGLQAGYRETESLLRRAESEINQTRKQKREPNPVVTRSDSSYEKLALTAFGLFWLSRFVVEVFSPFFDQITNSTGLIVSQAIYMPILGTLLGISSCWLLHLAGIKLSRKQIALTIMAFAVTMGITMVIAARWSEITKTSTGYMVMFPVFGLCVGTILSAAIRQQDQTFGLKHVSIHIIGWGLAFYLGQICVQMYYSYGSNWIQNDWLTKLIFFSLEAALAGLVGSTILFTQLSSNKKRKINWQTPVAAMLGFGVGSLTIEIIATLMEKSTTNALLLVMFWGLISGAFLEIPSKNLWRSLKLSLLCSIGFGIGQAVWYAVGMPIGFNEAFLAIFLGLLIGINTKKISSACILSLIVFVGFSLRFIVTDFYYNNFYPEFPEWDLYVMAVTASLVGIILGAAWSFLNGAESISSEKQVAK